MTVHSVSLWGHSKHLVSSVMSPAGDRPPEVLGLDSRSTRAHTHIHISLLPGQAPVSCLKLCLPELVQYHMHSDRDTQTLSPNADYHEPTDSLCIAETAFAQDETCNPQEQLLRLQGPPMPTSPLRSIWQVTDKFSLPLVTWFYVIAIVVVAYTSRGVY